MADNFTANAGSGGDTFAADDIGGVKHPRGKISIGADGAAADCAATNPLPIGGNTVKDGSGTVYALLLDSDGHQQCDIAGALPAGTNAIGKLAANTGVDIGDVDVTSVTPGTAASSLGKAEDGIHATGDVGVFVLAVRSDTAAQTAGTDGDYCGLTCDSSGRLHTNVSGAALTALEIIDDWDESDRAKVNIVAGQAGITAGAGVVAANTPRVTLASDDPAVAALQTIDNWSESSRAKVNPIVGVSGVAAGAGVVGTTTQRVTLASDDPGVTSLAILDDWDESDRAKVNPIAGQAGVAAGAGAVGATTQRVTLASDDPAVTALQILDDWDENDRAKVTAEMESNSMRASGTAVTPKFAVIDAASSGDNTLVAAVASKKIRVLAAFLVAAGTVNVRFESGASGTALTGQMNCVANTGFVLPYNPVGWFETASNTLLNLELSGAVSVDGCLTYIEV